MLEKFKDWCKNFGDSEVEPMDDKLSEIFIKMNMMEMDQEKSMDIILKLSGEFLYQVIDKRSKHIGLNLNPYVITFLMFLSRSPGTAVMYIYYIKSKYVAADIIVDMHGLTMLFPMGFPTEEELSKLWDMQKVGGNNMLDMLPSN